MKFCANCNIAIDCSEDSTCWCFDYPTILIPDSDTCLCKSCLENSIKVSIDNYLIDLNEEKRKTIESYGSPANLIEGIDYYINDLGFFVFTKWYHLRRGYCCGNGCLHCGWA